MEEPVYNVPGFVQIPPNQPSVLMKALDNGPVVASIRGGNPIFRHYSNGIIDSNDCTAKLSG